MSDSAFEEGAVAKRYGVIRAAIFGHVIGDAPGVPVEFSARQALERHSVSEMVGGGMRGVPPGTWSDDSSMTLCALESLIQCKGFDGEDMMGRFASWADEGYMTPAGSAFGIGQTTFAAFLVMAIARYMAACVRRIMAMASEVIADTAAQLAGCHHRIAHCGFHFSVCRKVLRDVECAAQGKFSPDAACLPLPQTPSFI